ncbi:MAG: hypothetical protein WBX22_22060 [Silvibacterium sp.]
MLAKLPERMRAAKFLLPAVGTSQLTGPGTIEGWNSNEASPLAVTP